MQDRAFLPVPAKFKMSLANIYLGQRFVATQIPAVDDLNKITAFAEHRIRSSVIKRCSGHPSFRFPGKPSEREPFGHGRFQAAAMQGSVVRQHQQNRKSATHNAIPLGATHFIRIHMPHKFWKTMHVKIQTFIQLAQHIWFASSKKRPTRKNNKPVHTKKELHSRELTNPNAHF